MADKNKNEQNMKILFLRPGKLGDMIVATPLFKAIKVQIPNSIIAVVASPYNQVIVRHNQHINILKVVNFHSLFSLIKLIVWIRKEKFNWVIDLTPEISTTSSIIARLVRSSRIKIAGMHKGEHSRYFDIVTENKDIHLIDRNRLLLEAVFDCSFTGDFRPDISIDIRNIKHAMDVLGDCSNNTFKIGINCSAGASMRQWTKNNYQKLLNAINSKYPHASVVLFSVGAQTAWVQEFKSVFDNIVEVCDVEFLTVAAIIQMLDYFITPDTSLLHVASAFKIPNVGLYCMGGENFIRWRAYKTVSKELVALESNDVNEITVEHVMAALCELIERNTETNV